MDRLPYLTALCCSLVLAGCAGSARPQPQGDGDVVRVEEAFLTVRDTTDNVDSPAVWHGPNGEHWLLATAKEGNTIVVYDAATGELVRRVGEGGTGGGSLSRPNGIAVVDDLMLVVERDNRRVQVFELPSFEPRGLLGTERMRRPYGLAVFPTDGDRYALFVTDNYEEPDESIPPDAELGERVHQYAFVVTDEGVEAEHVRAFGDTSGAGVLRKVESLWADPPHDRLLVADEDRLDLKVYTLDGAFTGERVGAGTFRYEPEGIALYACGEDAGYWITTDQDDFDNRFYVFDRMTMEHLGTFTGAVTANTDGIALTQRPFGPFPAGALYAVHDDGNVAAFSWAAIAEPLGLRTDCQG